MNPGPLVSCIMPTFNRRHFVPRAVEYFLRQDYARKQLIIVDDGSDSVQDLVPNTESVIYLRLNRKILLGEKRNIAIESSTGDIILHWDDDDWYADRRISYQLSFLMKEDATLCGLGAGLYYDIATDNFWRCQDRLHKKLFYAEIIGGSLCYRRSLWGKLGKFHPRTTLAEDSFFLRKIPNHWPILKLPNQDTLVYIRHLSNTWRFPCGTFVNPSEWIPVYEQKVMPEEDLAFYRGLRNELNRETSMV